VTAGSSPRDHAPPPPTLGDLLYTEAIPPVSEQEWVALVQRIAAGDPRTLQALYDRTHRLVFTLALRITSDRETAEEVTVDVFHDVWRRAATYESTGGSVIGWIMNQARSRAIDRQRFEHRKKRLPRDDDTALPVTAARGPHEAVDIAQQGQRLRDAVAELTPQERQAIEAAYFSELTYEEVAVRLNQPLGTVKTRIRSGLRKLRQTLGNTMGRE
jgi:RNA polymerase sigma-70 factor (ECF subfamily)